MNKMIMSTLAIMAAMGPTMEPYIQRKPTLEALSDEYLIAQMALIQAKTCDLPYRKRQHISNLYKYRGLDRAGRT